MKRSVVEFCQRIAPLLLLAAACGGESEHHSTTGGSTGGEAAMGASGGFASGSGGTGGSTGGEAAMGASGGFASGSGGTGGSTGGGPTGGNSGTGGGTPLPDCTPPIAEGETCSDPAAHCGGPCVNSWQADYACKDGSWTIDGVAACGPNADHAPQCRNEFSSGTLTPCCPEGGLDCRGQPDGYPGFGCTPQDDSFCSCGCYGEQQTCGC